MSIKLYLVKIVALLVLHFVFFVNTPALKAQNDSRGTPYIGLGITNHSYFYEGVLSTTRLDVDPFLRSIICSPTITLGYENRKWRSGLEVSYYANIVPGTDSTRDLLYSKRSFSIDYYLRLKSFRFGILYSSQDFRNLIFLSSVTNSSSVQKGLGFSFGLVRNDYSFDLRKELFIADIPNYGWDIASLFEMWTLRVSRRFPLLDEPLTQGGSKQGPFNMIIGASITGNPLYGKFAGQARTKLYSTFGFEYEVKKLGLSTYWTRSVWYALETRNDNFKQNSQVNHVGVAYFFGLRNDHDLKIGLHHVWNLDRSLLYLDFLENGYALSNLVSNYQNYGVGLNIRYELSKAFDVSLDTDIYYEANPILGTGFNDESLRLSLLYKL